MKTPKNKPADLSAGSSILERISEYLHLGGLFNPEMMEHDKVRDLIIACRDEINDLVKDRVRLNWLEEQNACLRFDAEDEASLPNAAVFLPALEEGESTFRTAGQGDDYREAIDDAMGQMSMSVGLNSVVWLLYATANKSCDTCIAQEGKHYCLLHSCQLKNMNTVRCKDWRADS
jgi:hypothetical protein